MLNPADLLLRQQAIDAGKTEYTRTNGQTYNIRNLNNPKHQFNYSNQGGRDELKSSRKANRGSGAVSTRARNERLSTPKGADKAAFGEAMTAASAQGKEAHHKTPVYLTGNALAEMSPKRQKEYHERYAKAGVPIGNLAENILGLYPKEHRTAHAEGKAVQDWLKNKNGGVGLNVQAIMTKSNMPTLGGFQEQETAPTILPGGSTYKPPQLGGMSQEYLPAEPPMTPNEDLSKQVMTILGIGAGMLYQGVKGVGGAVQFITGGGF